ncbi:MAG: GNAT family N-acetyltransferase [Cryobacterium sp.]
MLLDLAAGDLAAAGRAAGIEFPAFFAGEARLWTLHADRMVQHPASVGWLARAVVECATGMVVGHAGFHFNPDSNGMAEIGYTVVPEHRGRGLAKEIVGELLAFARAEGARTVRATVSPENAASLAVIRHWRFEEKGEQWDDEDGLELVFERPVQADGSVGD